jgi:Xaa-Pro aminopeptidase
MSIAQKVQQIRQSFIERNCDALLVSQPENRRYMSGFTGSAGHLLITPRETLLLTDFRYVEQSAHESPDFEIVQVNGEFHSHLQGLAVNHSLKTIAFESAHVTVAEFDKWRAAAPDVTWVPTERVVEALRMVKDEQELAIIRRAVRLADEAFSHAVPFIRPDATEQEVAWEIESYMRAHGAQKVAFDLIVASGPNGAMPHASVSDRQLRAGEPVVIDIGATVDTYHSDMTRTVCVGIPPVQFRKIYELVLRAQKTVEGALRPGMTGREADQMARDIITEAGFGPQFGHGLGHGVGLAVHEGPRLSQFSSDVLQPGMVVTVEPGIYVPDWGGVRIEDMVVITETGCEILTGSPTDLP